MRFFKASLIITCLVFASPALACPDGYYSCGGDLCCPDG
jgi:hypothetical protein